MTPERWHRITAVFQAALAREPAAREALLDEACAGDHVLRGEVDAMLAAHRDAGSFGDRPTPGLPAGETPRLGQGAPLGPYRIEEWIGAGGMGEVYRARDSRLDRDVAVKVLSASGFSDPDARRRLLREARAAAALNHPHVCTVHEVGEADGQVFIAMELIEGRRLDTIIPNGGLPAEEVLRTGLQIADAVAHAHERGIVHRDLKSSNTLVTPEGRVKVLDFGLAKRVAGQVSTHDTTESSALTDTGAVIGTIPYMSPEALGGQPADMRSDVWALGVILFEMAAGMRPFHGRTAFELSSAILTRPPAPLPTTVPRELRLVIERCLAKAPDRRYQRAGELHAALQGTQGEGARPWSPRRSRASALWLALAGTLLAGLAVVLGTDVAGLRGRFGGGSAPPPAIRMAVLPFENLTGDPEQEYLSDGLTEEMITQLGRLHPQRLSVIARTTAMRYKKTDKPVEQVGRELGVDYILEGGARREGTRVRITAQLIHVRDQTQRWAESYERELSGILALQRDVAEGVAGSLALTLLPAERARLANARAVDPEAYNAYLKGRFHWYRQTPQDLDAARQYFERALQKDPNYAVAYVGLADALATPAHMGFMPTTEVFPKARELVERALALDDTLPDAHDVRARLLFAWDWDWPAAERGFQRALELNPSYPDAHTVYAQLLLSSGRTGESIDEARRALVIDPQNPFYQWQVGLSLSGAGRHEEAIAAYRKVLAVDPNSYLAHDRLWDVHHLQGRPDDALREAKQSFVAIGRPDVAEALGRGLEGGGYARAMVEAAGVVATERSRRYLGAISIARFYVHAGLTDRAFEWLERAVVERDTRMVYLVGDPLYAPIRQDPRFAELLRRLKPAR